MQFQDAEAGLLCDTMQKQTATETEKTPGRPSLHICAMATPKSFSTLRKQDSNIPKEYQQAVYLIRTEAERFHVWNRSLKNWNLKRQDKYYKLFTTYDLLSQLLTLKVVVEWKGKQGDVLGAYQYLISSGDVERHDENISFDIMWNNNELSVERKIIKLPWPLSNRDLLYVTLQTYSEDEWILDTLSCHDTVEGVQLERGCVQAYMRGRHRVQRLSRDAYVYTWISQVDLRGRIPSWLMTLVLGKIGQSVTSACKLLDDANLEEINLTAFKTHLKSHGITKDMSML